MDVDEADRRVVNYQAREDITLVAVATLHARLDRNEGDVAKGISLSALDKDAGEKLQRQSVPASTEKT